LKADCNDRCRDRKPGVTRQGVPFHKSQNLCVKTLAVGTREVYTECGFKAIGSAKMRFSNIMIQACKSSIFVVMCLRVQSSGSISLSSAGCARKALSPAAARYFSFIVAGFSPVGRKPATERKALRLCRGRTSMFAIPNPHHAPPAV